MGPRDDALLQDLFDGRLDPSAEAAARARLEAEPALREAWDELARVRDLVRGAEADRAPPDFLTRVRARIAAGTEPDAVPAPAGPTPPTGATGPGRLLSFPHRLAVAASGLAALLLVAVGVRWMVGSGEPGPETDRVLESASAPADAPDLPGVRAPPEPRSRGGSPTRHAPGAVAPDAPPPAPSPAPGHFAPADQVAPNLRRPTDDAEPLERPAAKGAADDAVPADRAWVAPGSAAASTFTLEVDDLASGRARLALLVGGLSTDRRAAEPALRFGRADGQVLGSVLLCLTPDEATALAARPAAREAAERGDAEGSARKADGKAGHEDEDKVREGPSGAPDAETAGAAACVRVRVLLVRPPPSRQARGGGSSSD